MAVSNLYAESSSGGHVANRIHGLTSSLAGVGHVSDVVGITDGVRKIASASAATEQFLGKVPVLGNFLGISATPTVAQQATGYLGTAVEKIGGVAPLLATIGDGARLVGNAANLNGKKMLVNAGTIGAKVAAISIMAPIGLAALGVEGISWLATGKSTLTHAGDLVEHVFGESGEVTTAADAAKEKATAWRDKIAAERANAKQQTGNAVGA